MQMTDRDKAFRDGKINDSDHQNSMIAKSPSHKTIAVEKLSD